MPFQNSRMINLLLGLEVVEEDGALLGLLTPVLDNDARAVDNLAGVTLTVKLACSKEKAPVSPLHPAKKKKRPH
jgi:hypothetical protein